MKYRHALVTGGNKGIGLGIARKLVEQNISVTITGRNQDDINKVEEELNGLNKGKVLGFQCDVSDYSQMEEVVKKAEVAHGDIDVLVANAGVGHFASIEDLTLQQWNETIDTNLTGVFNSVKSSLGSLKRTQGYIITISSLAGTNFFAGGAAYNASKFGLTGFTQSIMLDLRNLGIKVTTIMPGSVATYFNNHTPVPADDWKIQIEDVGEMVFDLLRMNPRTLPSKIEVRPSIPGGKR